MYLAVDLRNDFLSVAENVDEQCNRSMNHFYHKARAEVVFCRYFLLHNMDKLPEIERENEIRQYILYGKICG